MLVFQATRLSPPESNFPTKLLGARTQAISYWMAKNWLMIRPGQAQEVPQVTGANSINYILHIAQPAVNPNLPHWDKQSIINMDQTPVFFLTHARRTINMVGNKTIHNQTAKQGLQRATVAVTFSAAGNQLQSLIIFKAKESTNGGKILIQE